MKASKYRKMTSEEMKEELEKARKEYDEALYDVKSRKEQDYAQLKFIRRKIAVIMTVLNEKERNIDEKADKKEKIKEENKKGRKKKKSKTSIKNLDKSLDKKTKDDEKEPKSKKQK